MEASGRASAPVHPLTYETKDPIAADKARRLRAAAESVLDSPSLTDELTRLMAGLDLSRQQVIDGYVAYDMDALAYDNTIYSYLAVRFAMHLHNLLPGSWHIERQAVTDAFINRSAARSLLDLGFGIPPSYVRRALVASTPQITLCDYDASAMQFARALLPLWHTDPFTRVTLLHRDMQDVAAIAGKYDLYLFRDSIEHVPDPTACLRQYVALAPPHAQFLLSLPIGPIMPQHYIAWETQADAEAWLGNCGIAVTQRQVVRVNRTVDIFAESLTGDLANLFVLGHRRDVGHRRKP